MNANLCGLFRKALFVGFTLLLMYSVGHAQTTHSVNLTITSPDVSSTAPGVVTVLRANGTCPATGVPTSGTTLTSSLSLSGTATYSDTTIVGGNSYCYWVTLKTQGGGTGTSNTFLASISVVVSITGTVQ